MGGKPESGVETGKVEQSIAQVSVGNGTILLRPLGAALELFPKGVSRWNMDSLKVLAASLLIWLTSDLPSSGLYNPLDRECPQAGRQRKTRGCLQVAFGVG